MVFQKKRGLNKIVDFLSANRANSYLIRKKVEDARVDFFGLVFVLLFANRRFNSINLS